MNIEHRSLVEPVEFRSDGGRIVASGVAMRYGARSKPIRGQFREVFQPGAFAKTLADKVDVRAHNEHGGPYLGRTANSTLRLVDGRSELGYELDLPDTAAGRDAATLLERRDIQGSSIGFIAPATAVKWSVDTDGMAMRSVETARLFVVDLTVAPAYDDSTASLALRSLADEKHMELRSVLEAAERGELPTLIASLEDEDEEQRSEQDGSLNSTVLRPRMSSLLY